MEKIKFRCGDCGRLLAKISGDVEIKCPRCGAMNEYVWSTKETKCVPKDGNAAQYGGRR